MKRKKIWVPLVLINLLIILIVIFIQPKPKISEENLKNIIFPQIENFCSNLESKAVLMSCPSCMYYPTGIMNDSTSYFRNKSLNYQFSKTLGGEYNVTVKVNIIYGANDRKGEQTLEFILNKNGEIINSNFHEEICKCGVFCN
jgi:hypothetical protein